MEPSNTTRPEPQGPTRRSRRSGVGAKLGLVGATGLLIGAAALGFGGIASADNPTTDGGAAADIEVLVDGDGGRVTAEISPDDEALLEEFEQCLHDAGFDDTALDGGEVTGEIGEESLAILGGDLDEVFEECEAILDDLDEGAFVGPVDLSAEDEAVLDRFDACLDEQNFDGEEPTDDELAALDEAFAECEPILDELSDEAGFGIFDDADCEHHDHLDGFPLEEHEEGAPTDDQ